MKPIYEKELYAVLKVAETEIAKPQSTLSKNKHYQRFYREVKDILERNKQP